MKKIDFTIELFLFVFWKHKLLSRFTDLYVVRKTSRICMYSAAWGDSFFFLILSQATTVWTVNDVKEKAPQLDIPG